MPLPMMENSCLEPWGRADPVPCDPTRGAFPCRWDAGDHPARGELQQHADPGVCEPHGDGQRDPEPAAGAAVLRGLSQGRTSGISARFYGTTQRCFTQVVPGQLLVQAQTP